MTISKEPSYWCDRWRRLCHWEQPAWSNQREGLRYTYSSCRKKSEFPPSRFKLAGAGLAELLPAPLPPPLLPPPPPAWPPVSGTSLSLVVLKVMRWFVRHDGGTILFIYLANLETWTARWKSQLHHHLRLELLLRLQLLRSPVDQKFFTQVLILNQIFCDTMKLIRQVPGCLNFTSLD